MIPKRPWQYSVPIRNPETGEQRTIVVTLFDDECHDALRQMPPCGGYDGLIVRGYALRHAAKITPTGFEPLVDDLEFVRLH